MRNLDKVSCILILPVLANLSMWGAMLAYPQLDRNDWFVNQVFGRLLVIGFISSIIGIIYTGYISIRLNRQTAEVATCCLLSAIAFAVNILGVLIIMTQIPWL